MKGRRGTYLFLGILLGVQGLFVLIIGILANSFAYHALPILGLAIISFCMSYLHPQFIQRDERMKMIREKGMFYSYFAILGYFIILMTFLQFSSIQITAMQVMNILLALIISTVFVSMTVVARKH